MITPALHCFEVSFIYSEGDSNFFPTHLHCSASVNNSWSATEVQYKELVQACAGVMSRQ